STYDFGDAIRFAANTAVEDETDLSKVELDMNKYEEFTKGFITASREFLTKKELDTMALGCIVITIELASRFLADHINGDKYFRIHRENHNLDRARCQIKLAQDMIKKYDKMCNIVMRYL
ncbi:MAG: mucin desulfatase, partial [Clostridiaceae bacterium]|nr:mucin desulfatase [Clostridiaceae bacterium]